MSQILTGIYIDPQFGREVVAATLQHLLAQLPAGSPVWLLNDGGAQDIETLVAAHPEFDLRHLRADVPRGRVAAFNELLGTAADYYFYLEAPLLLSPNCVQDLHAALESNPGYGIAAPSSNNCWNAQGLYDDAIPEGVDVAARAAEVASTYADTAPQEMDALVESCLLLSAAVVQAIGFGDAHFGRGYCWEVDYVHRAKLVGQQAVWVQKAYAHTAHIVQQGNRGDSFQENRRRYQDKICSRRQGKSLSYTCQVCTGGICAFPVTPESSALRETEAALPPPHEGLISCVMPTAGRPTFVRQAIRLFHRQSYPHKELIVVYEAETDLPQPRPGWPDVRYVMAPPGSSIGRKRNAGAAEARGDWIAHWDDDDWYAPNRLAVQAAPLLRGEADLSALRNIRFFVPAKWEIWETTPELFAHLFYKSATGSTYMYKRSWVQVVPFQDVSMREDAIFLEWLNYYNAKITVLDGAELFVYTRHEANSWRFVAGQYTDPGGWKQSSFPRDFGPDAYFYYAMFKAQIRTLPQETRDAIKAQLRPRVTCIMPTYNRRNFIPRALAYFHRQTYPACELIVVDDGEDAVGDLFSDPPPNVHYLRLEQRMRVGAKRNLAAAHARGDIILHWDDDDWIAPDWVARQVQHHLATDADITGITKAWYFDPARNAAWKYVYPDGEKPWVLGGSLCYDRVLWESRHFDEIDVGEDSDFVWREPALRIVPHGYEDGYVGLIHASNVSPKQTLGERWQSAPVAHVQALLGADMEALP